MKRAVRDPDGRVKILARGEMDEDEFESLVQDVKNNGSVQTYITAKRDGDDGTVEALEASGLTVSLSEEILRNGADSDWGTGFSGRLALILSHVGRIAVVEGWVGEEDNGARCRMPHYFHIASGYEFELWFGSCESLMTRHDGLDLVCVLESEEEEVAKLMQELLPQVEFYIVKEERGVSMWDDDGNLDEGRLRTEGLVLHIRLESADFGY